MCLKPLMIKLLERFASLLLLEFVLAFTSFVEFAIELFITLFAIFKVVEWTFLFRFLLVSCLLFNSSKSLLSSLHLLLVFITFLYSTITIDISKSLSPLFLFLFETFLSFNTESFLSLFDFLIHQSWCHYPETSCSFCNLFLVFFNYFQSIDRCLSSLNTDSTFSKASLSQFDLLCLGKFT